MLQQQQQKTCTKQQHFNITSDINATTLQQRLKKEAHLHCRRQVFSIKQQQQEIKRYKKYMRQHVASKPVDEATTFLYCCNKLSITKLMAVAQSQGQNRVLREMRR